MKSLLMGLCLMVRRGNGLLRLMGCSQASRPWLKTAPLERPMKRPMEKDLFHKEGKRTELLHCAGAELQKGDALPPLEAHEHHLQSWIASVLQTPGRTHGRKILSQTFLDLTAHTAVGGSYRANAHIRDRRKRSLRKGSFRSRNL